MIESCIQEGACKLKEDTKECLQELPQYSQEVIELASTLGYHSLGYLLRRDRNLEAALAEMPWLTRQDLDGIIVVNSDSFILEELSSSDLEPVEGGTGTIESLCTCTTYNVPASCSVPVVMTKPPNRLVKTLSFRSSGYHSLDSILVDSVPLLERTLLSNHSVETRSETSSLHWFDECNLESCWSEGSCKEFSQEVDAVDTQEAITEAESPVEFQVKDEESETVTFEDLSQYQLTCAVGFSKEGVQVAEQLGHHSLGYLLKRDKNLEEALCEIPWLAQIDSSGVTVIRSDSFILEELSNSYSMGSLKSEENRIDESNADPLPNVESSISANDGSANLNQVHDLSCYIPDFSMESKDSDQLFNDFSSLTSVFPPSTTNESWGSTTEDIDSLDNTVCTKTETPVSEDNRIITPKVNLITFPLSEYSSVAWESKDHFTAPAEFISQENGFLSSYGGYQNPSVMPTIIVTPPANDFPDSTTGQKADDVLSPLTDFQYGEVSSFTVTQPTAGVQEIASTSLKTVASFQGTESLSVACTLDDCNKYLEASLPMSMWENCGHPEQLSVYTGDSSCGMGKALQLHSVHGEASCGIGGSNPQPAVNTEADCARELEAIGGQEKRRPSPNSNLSRSTALIATLTAKTSPTNECSSHNHSKETPLFARVDVPQLDEVRESDLSGTIAMSAPAQMSFWESSAPIDNLNFSTVSSTNGSLLKESVSSTNLEDNTVVTTPSVTKWPTILNSPQFFEEENFTYTPSNLLQDHEEEDCGFQEERSFLHDDDVSLFSKEQSSSFVGDNFSTLAKTSSPPQGSPQFFEENSFEFPQQNCEEMQSNDHLLPSSPSASNSVLHIEARTRSSLKRVSSAVLERGSELVSIHDIHVPSQHLCLLEELPFSFSVSSLQTEEKWTNSHISNNDAMSNNNFAFSNTSLSMAISTVVVEESVRDTALVSCSTPMVVVIKSTQYYDPHNSWSQAEKQTKGKEEKRTGKMEAGLEVQRRERQGESVEQMTGHGHSEVTGVRTMPKTKSRQLLLFRIRRWRGKRYINLSASAPMLREEIVSYCAVSSIPDPEVVQHSPSMVHPTSSNYYFEVAGLCELSSPVNPTIQVPILDKKVRSRHESS